MERTIIVGSRDSVLAIEQTTWVIKLLQNKFPQAKFEIKQIKTKGDKILDVALSKIGDKGLFTKELEVAMLEGEIDFAVHSMKDLPTRLPDGLIIGCITKRVDSRDVVISHKGYTLATLPIGAKVGTSSLRRKSQLLKYRPDIAIADLRGNLHTRLAKMEAEDFDAIILAAAGIQRLGLTEKITEKISYDICLPAVGQGSVGVEVRGDNYEVIEMLKKINDDETEAAISAERSFLKKLEGGCQIPIGAQGFINSGTLTLEGLVASVDGTEIIKERISGTIEEAEDLGTALAQKLINLGAKEILNNIRQE